MALNETQLMGRLVRDPELRHTHNGSATCSFTLAVDRDNKNSNGEYETDWIDCVAWNSTAEFVSKYFTKGMMAVVTGTIRTRLWTDKNNSKRKNTEVKVDRIRFGETKKARGENYNAPQSNQNTYYPGVDCDDYSEIDDDDGEVPF